MEKRDKNGHFLPGTKVKGAGRRKGSKNKVTQEIRERFQALIENNMDKIQMDLYSMKPKERVDALLQLAQYVLPKLQTVAYKDETPYLNIRGIQVIATGKYLKESEGEYDGGEYDGIAGDGGSTLED